MAKSNEHEGYGLPPPESLYLGIRSPNSTPPTTLRRNPAGGVSPCDYPRLLRVCPTPCRACSVERVERGNAPHSGRIPTRSRTLSPSPLATNSTDRDEAATSPSPTRRLPSRHASATVPSPSFPQSVKRLLAGTAPLDCPPPSLPDPPTILTYPLPVANDFAVPTVPDDFVQPRNGRPSRQDLPRAAPCRPRHLPPRGHVPVPRLPHRATEYGRRDGATRRRHGACTDNYCLPRRRRAEASRRPQESARACNEPGHGIDASPMTTWSTMNACGFAQLGDGEPGEARLANPGERRLQ